jgi:hypothetical protein
MKIEVITSFHKPYYDLIGKDSISSFLLYWPSEVSLTCYVEGFSLPEELKINQISFDSFGQEYVDFQQREYSGNVKKFAKKAFSFIHAMEHSTADRIIWLDADVLTTKQIPLTFLKDHLPDDVLSTHMGVTYRDAKDGRVGEWYVPETGFFAVNTRHPSFDKFRKRYKTIYVNGEFDGLRRWYDNDVYGHVLESLKAKTFDLCGDAKKEYKTPMKHTVLNEYLIHYKAKHSKVNYQEAQ